MYKGFSFTWLLSYWCVGQTAFYGLLYYTYGSRVNCYKFKSLYKFRYLMGLCRYYSRILQPIHSIKNWSQCHYIIILKTIRRLDLKNFQQFSIWREIDIVLNLTKLSLPADFLSSLKNISAAFMLFVYRVGFC